MMTPNQVKLLDFIRAEIETTGSAPNFDEMCQHMKKGRQTVFELVEQLVDDGYLAKETGRRRGLSLVEPYRSIIDVPTPVLRAELVRRGVAA